jgi:glycerophosphoryl diester phosphodiesterase
MKILLIIFFALSFAACVENDNPLPIPTRDPQKSRLAHATPIPRSVLHTLEGVYTIEHGDAQFGSQLVLKKTGDHISLFTANSRYLVFETGYVDSLAIFEGYWRYDVGTLTGYATLDIGKDFNTKTKDTNFILKGYYNPNGATNNVPLVLHYKRPLTDTTNNFLILDHHGGQNGAGFPYSENSLNSIRFAQFIGSNGIEIDVKLTADNVPILFHDNNLSTNLVNGEFAIGPIGNYTLAELRALCTLTDGEPIPTLQEALDVIFNETDYKVIWLDIKDSGTVQYVLPLEINFINQAKAAGKDIIIWAGLPSTDHVTAYLANPLHSQATSLCELLPSDVDRAGCVAWGPRWTAGDQVDQAKPLRKEGKKVVYWTLDKPEFINPFLNHGNLDGLLTDHPGTVAYYYYIRE